MKVKELIEKLKKFLVVHSDGTRDIVKAVNDEFLEILVNSFINPW